jgi:16S rRNA (guanine527-N7)-methyltransferase
VVDLGSGAGLPGLVLALRWTSATMVLVDAHRRRGRFLLHAVDELGLAGRVVVAVERAEVLGRTPARRGAFDVATARGFGRPAVVAECAAPLLGVGGVLVVSEPPPDRGSQTVRWPGDGLALLGMGPPRPIGAAGYRFVGVTQQTPCPPRYPRRVGVPAKRLLF